MRDNRSVRRRLWSAAAAICIEALALFAMIAAAQLSAARTSSQRLARELRKELAGYRMVLLAPRLQPPQPAFPAPPVRTAARRARREPKPLSIPDTRLLDRLDPQVAGYVKENPAVEGVLTREIVRDLDSGVLDPRKLLEKSSLRVSFEVAATGRVSRPVVEKSSGVPSIDHMAIELSKTLSEYQLPTAMDAIRRMAISIEIGEDILIRVEGTLRNPEEIEQVRKQVQNALALFRFALGNGDGAFMLQEVAVTAGNGRITLTRRVGKTPVLDLLARYYRQEER